LASEITSCGTTVSYLAGRGLLDVGRLARLARLIRGLGPDLVHTHLSYANILGVLAARLAGRPAVASIRNVTTDQTRFDRSKRIIQSVILRLLADRVIVVARTAVAETQRNFRLPQDRLTVLPNAIDQNRLHLPADFDRTTKRRELAISVDEAVICTVARLDPGKGHRFLLRAAATLRQRYPAARYLVVGTGRDDDALRAQAAALGVADIVKFLGLRRDVPEILAASDLFVLPSLNEGLSRAMLEAMAVGTPVVATDVGGAADVLISNQTGWLVPPGDPAALAGAIGEALRDPQQAFTYARRATTLVREHYGVGPHVAHLEAIYRDVLNRAPPREELSRLPGT
jgi:glycosyltransferase involved in cell wall biosynthesis